ncbi:MAG: adenosylcobinamide-GDP ribazoletransferase [Bacillota bacterium]
MKTWRRFLSAVSFLTRVPLPSSVQLDEASLSESPPMFPVVGALIGAAVASFDYLVCLILPSPAVAVVDLAAVFLLTGGLHLDGLLDTADGLLSGKPRERALEIMKDSRVGAMGVAVGILLVGLKVASIAALAGERRFAALLLAPVLGRYAMLTGMTVFPYARTAGGLGSLFKDKVRLHWMVAPGVFAVALAAAVAGVPGIAAFAACVLMALGLGRLVTGRLGGLTGDVHGALCEVAEAAVYVVFAARW